MANAGFRCGIRISSVPKPRAFFDQALEAAGPLEEELVHVVAAHLVHDQEHDELGFGGCSRRLGSCRARRQGLGRGGRHKRNAASEKSCCHHRCAPQETAILQEFIRNHGRAASRPRVYYDRVTVR